MKRGISLLAGLVLALGLLVSYLHSPESGAGSAVAAGPIVPGRYIVTRII